MTIGSNSSAELQSLIERVERLDEQKKALTDDIKAVFGEAKAIGFDTKAMRKVIAERKLDLTDRRERRAVFDLYADKTNLYGDTGDEDFV
jgi:uncharacterized protein (UPF0335 family)